jgi:hypothetical protein
MIKEIIDRIGRPSHGFISASVQGLEPSAIEMYPNVPTSIINGNFKFVAKAEAKPKTKIIITLVDHEYLII